LNNIGERGGVSFVDDSKATNIAALCAALRAVKGPVRLIAGGRSKGDDPFEALSLLLDKVSGVYLIGEAAGDMFLKWQDAVPCSICETLDRATRMACDSAKPGETVLLSPGCLSWDQFPDFGKRGDAFIRYCGFAKSTLV
jgi:UDP-N-acetylmuramoylalanine--D-glutamate ligase